MRTLNVNNFLRQFNGSKVYYDPAFQRDECWKTSTLNKFLESLTRGAARHPITLLDAEVCKEYSDQVGDAASSRYFIDILQRGYRYVSLDGQNRTKNTEKFMNNEVAISGDFLDADNYIHTIDNQFFKDLPRRLQDHFRTGCHIVVDIVEGYTREYASTMFRNINSGEPLNDAEKRNAINSPMASEIRNLSKVNNAALQRLFANGKAKRKQDDELVAKMMVMLTSAVAYRELKSSTLDKFYELGVGFNTIHDPSIAYDKNELKRAASIIEMTLNVVDNQTAYQKSKALPAKYFWGVFAACEWLYDNSYEIIDRATFFNSLKEIDNKLINSGESAYVLARTAKITARQDPEEISKLGYYHSWTARPHQKSYWNKRKSSLIQEVKGNLKKLKVRKLATSSCNVA